MTYITTTELRTKSKELINTLLAGHSVDLVHRSRIVASFQPKKKAGKALTSTDIEELTNLAKKLNLPKLSYKEREARYRKHLLKKYGKGLS